VGQQLVETIMLHKDVDRKEAWKMAETWLKKVRIPDAEERMYAYPFQLSGGMQQRVMIAMALMLEPDIIIADEPTTALDVTIQAQIFQLIRDIRQRHTAIVLITHDMGVVWEMCDRVIVMYASRIAEEGRLTDIFSTPAHHYTQGLLASIPRLSGTPGRLTAIAGYVPSPFKYPSGCHFRDRCPYAFDRCEKEVPPLIDVSLGHRSACFLAKTLVTEFE
jgi:peptide/nickel transport system ATP-binding protein/oligopeptide transport system ATP-binding protein